MAINYFAPRQLSAVEYGGMPDIGEAIRSGLKTARETSDTVYKPHQLAQELLKSKLSNKLESAKLPYAEKLIQAELLQKQAAAQNSFSQMRKNQLEMDQLKAFRDLVSGKASSPTLNDKVSNGFNINSSANPATSPSYGGTGNQFNQVENSPALMQSNETNQPFQAQQKQSYPQQLQQAYQPQQPQLQQQLQQPSTLQEKVSLGMNPKGNAKIVNPGNPNLYRIDKLYDENPLFRKNFESLGMKKSQSVKTNPETGEVFLTTTMPSGQTSIEAIDIGKSPKTVAREKEQGKYAGQLYGKELDSIGSLQSQNDSLDRMIDNVENNARSLDVIGPVNSYIAKLVGTPEDKQLLGDLTTGTGNIILSIAHDLKGAWTGRDMAMANSIKPNPSDTYDVFIGKLKAMRSLNELAKQRLELSADLIDTGMAPHKAMKLAQDKVSFTPIEKQISSMLTTAKQRSVMREGKVPEFSSKQEADTFLNQLSPQEKQQLLQRMRGR